MTRLKCNVENCYFNKSNKCCRESIKVKGLDATVEEATYCNDFKEKRDSMTSKECHCDKGAQNILDVGCNAVRCVYNDNARCHADQIGIIGNGAKHCSQTACESFKYYEKK